MKDTSENLSRTNDSVMLQQSVINEDTNVLKTIIQSHEEIHISNHCPRRQIEKHSSRGPHKKGFVAPAAREDNGKLIRLSEIS